MKPLGADRRDPAPRTRTLGFYLSRSSFPADRGRLVCEARRSGAPDEIVAALISLPAPPVVFEDLRAVSELWTMDGQHDEQ